MLEMHKLLGLRVRLDDLRRRVGLMLRVSRKVIYGTQRRIVVKRTRTCTGVNICFDIGLLRTTTRGKRVGRGPGAVKQGRVEAVCRRCRIWGGGASQLPVSHMVVPRPISSVINVYGWGWTF